MTAPTPRRRPASFAVTPTEHGLAVAELRDFDPWPTGAVLLFDEGGALVSVTTSTAKWGPVDEIRPRSAGPAGGLARAFASKQPTSWAAKP